MLIKLIYLIIILHKIIVCDFAGIGDVCAGQVT